MTYPARLLACCIVCCLVACSVWVLKPKPLPKKPQTFELRDVKRYDMGCGPMWCDTQVLVWLRVQNRTDKPVVAKLLCQYRVDKELSEKDASITVPAMKSREVMIAHAVSTELPQHGVGSVRCRRDAEPWTGWRYFSLPVVLRFP